jgi:adenylate cyclase
MERKLAAVFSADVKGYSRLMGDDEEATIRTLTAYRGLMSTLIQHYRGRVVDSPGDNLLAEFASAVEAVQGAVEIQRELKAKNAALPDARKMEFRIGINVGDVIVEGERLYGDGVNIAARLEGIAEAGGICIAGTVYDQVKTKLPFHYEYLGEQAVKNITEPVRVWRLVLKVPSPLAGEGQSEEVVGEAERQKAKVKAQTERRVGSALQHWAVVGMGGLLLLVGTFVAVRYHSVPKLSPQSSSLMPQGAQALPLPDKPSIAVLPFVNMSADPEQEYFSDGMTEDIITDLSKLSSLFVIARNSTFTYKGKAVDVKNVGRELGVQYVLEGSVQRASDQLRINAQLVDATTGAHVWAERYDRLLQAQTIFAVQDDITRQIVLALGVEMWKAEVERVGRAPTDNLNAYDAVLRAISYLLRPTKETNTQARQLAERAIALDPQYATGYVTMGWVYFHQWIWQWSPGPSALERASEMAQRALALDNSHPYAHMTLGGVYLFQRKHEQALAEMERAIALEPNFADAHMWLALTLNYMGRPEEAIGWAEKAIRLNPYYPGWYLNFLGMAYFLTGRYEEALTVEKKALTLTPNLDTHAGLAGVYITLGREEEARAEAAEILRMSPNFLVDAWGQMLPFKNPADSERYLAPLRKAGLK